MKGVIDMHVHTNPDIRKRAYDDFELMEAGIRVGARAIVIKTHQGTTMDRAYLCNRHNRIIHGDSNDFTMYGGIVMNRVVGGINPRAVEVALKLGAKVVWLPTQSAENHIRKLHGDMKNLVEVIRDGKPVPELKDIFRLVNEYDVVLATAHLTPEESFIVVEAARNAGVRKIVVTHPEWWLVGMSPEDQIRMVRDYDVILERCYAQSERMNKLLLDMSALTKLDEIDDNQSEARKDYRPVDVLQIIQSVLDDTALQLQEKGIDPSLQLPQHVEVLGDQSLIYSIFRNLIDNAIAYATGASLLKITCAEVEKEGRHFYEFAVSDNGQGVEAQHREHLFERFYRVDKGRSRKLGGTGLGLAIVKNAVAAHGGQATALSTPGGGLTIRFTLARF